VSLKPRGEVIFDPFLDCRQVEVRIFSRATEVGGQSMLRKDQTFGSGLKIRYIRLAFSTKYLRNELIYLWEMDVKVVEGLETGE
jgi:hypothetical protein